MEETLVKENNQHSKMLYFTIFLHSAADMHVIVLSTAIFETSPFSKKLLVKPLWV